MKRLLPILLILVLVASLIPALFPQSAEAAWLTDYTYRKSITITGSSSENATNYQVPFTVYSGTGTDNISTSPVSVYLGGHCQEWPDDIRFTSSDEETPIDYWIESYDASSATVWVEVPFVEEDSTATIYLYYGNSGAASASNGANTWLHYDDASDNLVADYTLRDVYNAGLNGVLTYDSVNDRYQVAVTNDGVFVEINTLAAKGNYRVYSSLASNKGDGSSNLQLGLAGRYVGGAGGGIYYSRAILAYSGSNCNYRHLSLMKQANPPSTSETSLDDDLISSCLGNDTWYTHRLTMYGDSISAWISLGDTSSSASDSSYSSGTWGIWTAYNSGCLIYFKDVRVGNYISPEPYPSAIGSEEWNPPTVTTDNATGILSTSATLHGTIVSTGGQDASTRGFEWDTDSGAPYANEVHEDGTYGTGTFSLGASGMPADTTIYYRAYATNDEGTGYGSELTFATLEALPQAPTNFTVTKTSTTEALLTWAKWPTADTTIIRRGTDTFPTSITEGEEIYNGTLETYSDLTVNLDTQVYYYSAWSYSDSGYSTDYATEQIGGSTMLLIALIGLACFLTFFSGWRRYLPSSMAASIAWVGLGVLWLISPTTIGVDSSEQWVQYFGFVFLLLAIVPVMLYLRPMTTMHRETTMKDALGRTIRSGFTEQKYSSGKKSSSKARQLDYKAQLRERWGRR